MSTIKYDHKFNFHFLPSFSARSAPGGHGALYLRSCGYRLNAAFLAVMQIGVVIQLKIPLAYNTPVASIPYRVRARDFAPSPRPNIEPGNPHAGKILLAGWLALKFRWRQLDTLTLSSEILYRYGFSFHFHFLLL
jgi:hypothetical protein